MDTGRATAHASRQRTSWFAFHREHWSMLAHRMIAPDTRGDIPTAAVMAFIAKSNRLAAVQTLA
jgi:hypothetical protein